MTPFAGTSPLGVPSAFSQYARDVFAACYPETPHKVRHALPEHPLLSLEALAELSESLPARSVLCCRGDVPVGATGKPQGNGLSIGATIRGIAQVSSRAVLCNVEQHPAYAALVLALVDEIAPEIEARTGRMRDIRGNIHLSSPGAVTPYHFDPEHILVIQLAGTKVVTQFPAGDPAFAPDEAHEAFHIAGGRQELAWDREFLADGTDWNLRPGDAVYLPAMAPRFVRTGEQPAISLSIGWRSDWSYAEADARAFNALLRRFGMAPAPPGRWPAGNRGKAFLWRLARKVARAN